MQSRVVVYTSLMRVPKVFLPTLFKLTMGRRGYMLLAAQVLIGWRIKKPVAIAFVEGWPVGWMFFDPIDKNKLNMYVAKPYRHLGLARRMAVALKKKYPHMRQGVYYGYVANVIKGLAKPRAKY
jgi:hypothetical protein